ncbi:hypothetical protein FRC09_010265 [Ceratobasidium sp. 395]|nr:hypothetical protein FRC09_010265 [Ceratobasidium sp. 395]
MNKPPASDTAKARRKAKRAAKAQVEESINEELSDIEDRLHELIDAAATKLDVGAEEIRSRFLAYTGSRSSARPTAWNGSSYSGGAYMLYVLKRIREEELYEDMSDEMKERYIKVAQQVRDDKLNAGSARSGSKHTTQGSVKDQLEEIGEKLNYIHNATQVEYILMSVRGKPKDGLQAVYYASNKVRSFIESHLTIEMNQLLTLMESAALGGAQRLADRSHTETAQAKSEVCKAMLKLLRDAAAAAASDGSPPTATNPNAIPFVEWKNYHNTVKQYKVVIYNWPMKTSGQMMDPNSMGLGQLPVLLRRIRDEECGFKRLTEAEWTEWTDKFESEIKSGTVEVPLRKTQCNAGKKRKIMETSKESAGNCDEEGQRHGSPMTLGNESEPQTTPSTAGAPALERLNEARAPSPSALFEPCFHTAQPIHPFNNPPLEALPAPDPTIWPSLGASIGLVQGNFSDLESSGTIQPPPFTPQVPASPQSSSLRFRNVETPETFALRAGSPRRSRSRTPANPLPSHQQPVRTLRSRTVTRTMSPALATSTLPVSLPPSQSQGFYSEFAPPGV